MLHQTQGVLYTLPVEFFKQPGLGGLGEGERAQTNNQVERGAAGLHAPPGALRTS